MDFVFLVTSGLCVLAICIALSYLVMVLRHRVTRAGPTEPNAILPPEFRSGGSAGRHPRSSRP